VTITFSEEGEDCPIGRKGDGLRFLGFTRCDLHRLPREGHNGHRVELCRIIGPIRRRISENTATFGEEKSALPSWQRTGSHFRPRQGQIGRIGLRTTTTTTTPCDLFLFPNLKKSRTGQKFASNEEVVATTDAKDLKKTYFSDGLIKLEYRWVKCIELKGDYVEKQIAPFPKFSFFFWRLSTYRTTLVLCSFL